MFSKIKFGVLVMFRLQFVIFSVAMRFSAKFCIYEQIKTYIYWHVSKNMYKYTKKIIIDIYILLLYIYIYIYIYIYMYICKIMNKWDIVMEIWSKSRMVNI